MTSIRVFSAKFIILCLLFQFFRITHASGEDLWEPNDERSRAAEITPLGLGEPRLAASLNTLGSVPDDDWYFREGGSLHDKWVSAWIEPIDLLTLDTEMELFEWNNPTRVAHNDDIKSGNVDPIRQSGLAGVPILANASSVVHVYAWNHHPLTQGGYRLNLLRVLKHASFEFGESESNDTIGEANDFSISQSVVGRISSATDVDWFKVGKTVPRNEDLLVVLKNESTGNADLEVKIYNQDGTVEYTGIALSGGGGEHDYLRIPHGSHSDDFLSLRVRSASGTGDYRLLVGIGTAAVCPGPYRSEPIATIPDWAAGSVGILSDTITVPADSGTIADLRVFMDISHDSLLDLKIELTHVDAGSQVLLFDRACTTTANVSTVFDDFAGGRVCPPVHLSATPEEPLSAFNGEPAAGDWRLDVSDVAPGSVGVLNQWCLLIPTRVPSPTPTHTPTMTPTPTATSTVRPGASLFCKESNRAIADDDPNGATDTLTISADEEIQDLNLRVEIEHPDVGELLIALVNIDTGINIQTQRFQCSGTANEDAVFDDEGVPISCPPHSGLRVVPFQFLSTFSGLNIQGTWGLRVVDQTAGNRGTLKGWCLELNAGPTPTPSNTPTSTLTPTPTETNTPRVFDCNSPYTSEPSAAIPDATDAATGILEDIITISDHRTIGDLNVFVSIDHEDIGDVGVSLENVDTGFTANLYSGQCGQETALFTVFDDEGVPLTCPPVDPDAPVLPDNPFALLDRFDGMDLAGDWKLIVADLTIGDSGTLNKWCLIITDATPITPCNRTADLNSDGEVDSRDLLETLRQIRGSATPGSASGDLNCDGKLTDTDLLLFDLAWDPRDAP